MNTITEDNKNYNKNKQLLGSMSLEEFIEYTNPRHKVTPTNAYTSTLKEENFSQTVIRIWMVDTIVTFNNIYRDSATMIKFAHENKTDYAVLDLKNKTLYYNDKVEKKQLGHLIDQIEENITKTTVTQKRVKYLPEMKFSSTPPEDAKLINRKRIAGKRIAFYMTEFGIIAYDVDINAEVGEALNEWGALLVKVVDEYRGMKLGEILIKMAYEHLPELYDTGGYSQAGLKSAKRVWAQIVSEMLANGEYSKLVRDGTLTMEHVKKIVKQAKEIDQKLFTPKDDNEEKPELLIYSDLESMFILYDKRFYTDLSEDEEPQEKYIYGHGFIRYIEPRDKWKIYSIDYERDYRQLSTYLIFQVAKEDNIKISRQYSDILEIDDMEHLVRDGDDLYLDKDIIDLKKYAYHESKVRKKHDSYNEFYYQLMEMANSKWN